MVVQKIYGVPPPPPEEHHKAINHINTIVQGMQTQRNKLEVLAQSNTIMKSSNSVEMEQLAQMTVTMNAMQAQLKTFSSDTTKPTRNKKRNYYWSFRSNYTHGSKILSAKQAVHREKANYKKRPGGTKKGCK